MGCKCRRIKRNFPFGRKSSPRRFCKDCGRVISSLEIKQRKGRENEKTKKKWKE